MTNISKIPNSGTYVLMLSGGLDSALLSYLILKQLPNTKLVLSSVIFFGQIVEAKE